MAFAQIYAAHDAVFVENSSRIALCCRLPEVSDVLRTLPAGGLLKVATLKGGDEPEAQDALPVLGPDSEQELVLQLQPSLVDFDATWGNCEEWTVTFSAAEAHGSPIGLRRERDFEPSLPQLLSSLTLGETTAPLHPAMPTRHSLGLIATSLLLRAPHVTPQMALEPAAVSAAAEVAAALKQSSLHLPIEKLYKIARAAAAEGRGLPRRAVDAVPGLTELQLRRIHLALTSVTAATTSEQFQELMEPLQQQILEQHHFFTNKTKEVETRLQRIFSDISMQLDRMDLKSVFAEWAAPQGEELVMSKEEFSSFVRSHQPKLSKTEVEHLFQQMEAEGSKISLAGFMARFGGEEEQYSSDLGSEEEGDADASSN